MTVSYWTVLVLTSFKELVDHTRQYFPLGTLGRVACAAWQSHASEVEFEPEQVLELSGASVLEERGSEFVFNRRGAFKGTNTLLENCGRRDGTRGSKRREFGVNRGPRVEFLGEMTLSFHRV